MQAMDTLDMLEMVRGAQETFAFLRLLFWQEPTPAFLENLQGVAFITDGEDADEISDGLEMVHQAVLDNGGRLDAYAEELAVEYARLFLGPINPVAIPFASYYLSESKTVMTDDVTLAVREKYLKAGMAMQALYQIPDDHIAAELEFVSWLAGKVMEEAAKGEQAEAARYHELFVTFLRQHMATWVPDFSQAVTTNTRQRFYRGAARALEASVVFFS